MVPGSTAARSCGFELPLRRGPVWRGASLTLVRWLRARAGQTWSWGLSFAFLGFVLINGAFKFFINTMQGPHGRAHAAAPALRADRPGAALSRCLHLRKVKQAEYGNHDQGRGGTAGRLHRRRLRQPGLSWAARRSPPWSSSWCSPCGWADPSRRDRAVPGLLDSEACASESWSWANKERQLTARQLAGRVAELVDGGIEVQAHDTSNFRARRNRQRAWATFSASATRCFQRKFFVKFLNNLLSQFTPFVFYSLRRLSGDLCGHLDIGALVAVIAAYKDLPGPVKELIDWEQQRADVQIKYDQVIEQFQPPEMIEPWVARPCKTSATIRGRRSRARS